VSSTGSTESHRVRLNLTLEVNRVEWAPARAAGETTSVSDNANPNAQQASTAGLSISGRVVSENPHVKMGAFHTLDIEANRDIRIEKIIDGWDSIALARVEESCVPGRGAEVAAVVCGEGTAPAHIWTLISKRMALRHRGLLPSF
jgi:protein pelota